MNKIRNIVKSSMRVLLAIVLVSQAVRTETGLLPSRNTVISTVAVAGLGLGFAGFFAGPKAAQPKVPTKKEIWAQWTKAAVLTSVGGALAYLQRENLYNAASSLLEVGASACKGGSEEVTIGDKVATGILAGICGLTTIWTGLPQMAADGFWSAVNL